MARIGRASVLWVIAGLIVLSGVAVVVVGLLTPVTFGWFAYQPLAEAAFTPGGDGVFLSRVTVVGFVLTTAGLLCLALLAGWRMGAAQGRDVENSDRPS
ncbi:hypothetical protein [Microbacterium sp. SS28]|uniref:hypothetical protein n=1 Tax=Microbacterium sp. SS28 TaxID=2919948 RepID=UPI001FAAF891|nr:hypothetical protein [Microbacterium sp. SS28]